MKYIITVLMILPCLYCFSHTEEIPPFSFSSTSGSISGTPTNALESTGCSDGSIELQINNGNGPYYVEWSNGETTTDLDNLTPGEYCVTVTDNLCGIATGCWEVKCCPFLLEEDQIDINVIHPACESALGELELALSGIPGGEFPLNIILENEDNNYVYDLPIDSPELTIDDLTTGGYQAYLSYGDGCGSSFEFHIETKSIEIEFETTASCDEDGSISVSSSNGKLPLSYSWSDDTNIDSDYRSDLGSGLYTVTITDANLCAASASVYIKNADPIDISPLSVFIGPTDCDENNGLIDISNEPSGGNPPFTYHWDNGEIGKFLTGLEGGKHTLTIIDSEGCELSEVYWVPTEGLPEIIEEQVENTCDNENFGTIGVLAVNVNGSIPNYEWSTGSNLPIIDNLASGTYVLTLTDPNTNCQLVKEYEIETFNSSPIIISGNSINDCGGISNNDGQVNITIEGGVPPYTYQWSNGSTGKNIYNLSKGTYYLNVTDFCGASSTYTAYVDEVNIDPHLDWELNFGVSTLSSDPTGGEAPYTFLWSNGATEQSIEVTNQDTYSVTVTDNLGCTATQEIDVSFECVDLELQADISPNGFLCSLPIFIRLNPTNDNQTVLGSPPFKVKVQKVEGEELVTKDYSVVSSIYDLNNYFFTMPSGGRFVVTVTDNCGQKTVDILTSCFECYYDFYNEDGNVFADLFNGLITFEQVCPCDEDCDFGFTHDKIKLLVDEDGIFNSVLPWNLFNFTITWPNDSTTLITKSAIGINPTEFSVSIIGPTEYVLSDEDFENGVVVNVTYNAMEGGVFQEQCQIDVPFEFNQKGRNGQFEMWQSQNNPFSPNYELPYYQGTYVCNTKCEIPLETGNLYGNQPTDVWDNVIIECDEDNLDPERNVFQFYPLDYSDPCYGGGYLRTHVELNGQIYLTTKYIAPDVAIDHSIWTTYLPLDDQGNVCSADALYRGYCLFEGLDVYGIETYEHLIAAYCSDEIFVPIVDSDGDGIPDDQDPCPFDPSSFCDEDDDDDLDNDIDDETDPAGCKTVYYPDECKIALICPGQEPEYFEGSISYETVSDIHPCIYCASAEFCSVTDPITGELIFKPIGPISNGVNIDENENGCHDGGLCKVTFSCESNDEYIHHICVPGCTTTTTTLKLCTDQQVFNILNSFSSNVPDTTYLNMSYEEVQEIINRNRGIKLLGRESKELETIPNPSQSDFLVKFNSKKASTSTVEIRNIAKELVYSQEFNISTGKNLITIENDLPTGLYIISIRLEDKIISTKHVIQK